MNELETMWCEAIVAYWCRITAMVSILGGRESKSRVRTRNVWRRSRMSSAHAIRQQVRVCCKMQFYINSWQYSRRLNFLRVFFGRIEENHDSCMSATDDVVKNWAQGPECATQWNVAFDVHVLLLKGLLGCDPAGRHITKTTISCSLPWEPLSHT
jgi:hypothetical protein